MNIEALRGRARRARDAAAREKYQLFLKAWSACQALAEDQVHARIRGAREQLESRTLAAADQGKAEVALVRLPLDPQDLRQLVQAELHQSQQRQPDPYPQLRLQEPPSFRQLEGWLRDELKLEDLEKRPPLDWLVALHGWLEGRERAGWLKRLTQRRPRASAELEGLFQECRQLGLEPRFESYRQFDERGVALIVRWQP